MARFFLDGRMNAGGVGRYRDELVDGLGATALEHEILVVRRKGDSRIGWDACFVPWGLRRVAKEAVRSRADLLHGLHFEVPQLPTVPVVVTIPDLIPLDFPASMRSPVYRSWFHRLVASSVQRSARIIVTSAVTASSLIRRGTSASKIEVIPLGVGSPFSPIEEPERLRAQTCFGSGRPYVAAVAESRPHKNRAGLFAVAAQLPDVTFSCRGQGSVDAPENINFIPFLNKSELALFYGGAQVLLMMSLVEGFGLPALEAAACGTPVLCGSEVGGARYLGAGTLVIDPYEPRETARRLRAFLRDEGLKKETSRAAEAAASKLTPGVMAANTLALYMEVLSEA
jgi:glycosyltransferase involved in cell wall biosynthesis